MTVAAFRWAGFLLFVAVQAHLVTGIAPERRDFADLIAMADGAVRALPVRFVIESDAPRFRFSRHLLGGVGGAGVGFRRRYLCDGGGIFRGGFYRLRGFGWDCR